MVDDGGERRSVFADRYMSSRRRREIVKRRYVLLALAVCGVVSWSVMISMPGKSFRGAPLPLLPPELILRDELAAHVQKLAGEIGERNMAHYSKLGVAADYIEASFAQAGFRPRRHGYEVQGKLCENIAAEVLGTGQEILVIGAHYDSVVGSPGANDNASGVAALLALARRFAGRPSTKTLRFVAFPNEEPGHFQTDQMGSWVYARQCKEKAEPIAGMISLETIGYYSDAAGSQQFPLRGLSAFYGTKGNFIAFVGNLSSAAFVRRSLGAFRQRATLPSEGTALPARVPGVGWSDHWSFWQHGYRALMITDTAPFRYPHYHQRTDTPDKLHYESMARLVHGLEHVIATLGNDADRRRVR